MYFKRIELNGFKSFADPITIEFDKGITCIVGPNGSGKSNISDAIRWVLGEQSSKSLRGGKMEDVIFAGTQNRKSKGMAEVTLVLDNTDRSLPLDFSEIGLTRRMYRSGESEYMINRTPCRLRDIRELIMDTGIGVEGYSIIGQGKIADIVSNKMESRREIFEEAAGIVKYRNKKADTEKNLASANQNLDRVNDIVYEIESRIDSLKKESEKAIEYVELKERYKYSQINILLRNISSSEERAAAVSQELSELEAELESIRSEKDSLDEESLNLRNTADAREARLNDLRDQLLAKSEEITSITSRSQLNRERLSMLLSEKERLEAEVEEIARKKADEEAQLAELAKASAEAKAQLAGFAQQLAEKSAQLAAAVAVQGEAERALEERKNLIFELSAKQNSAKVEAQSTLSLKQSLERRMERLKEDESQRLESSREFEEKIEKLALDQQELEKAEERIKKSLLDAQTALSEAQKNIEKYRSDAEALRIESGQLSARSKLLDELESSYEGYSGGVRFIMKSGIKGIVGAFGELIDVPKGWELAIETILGARMQDIVCDNDATAKKAIQLLKQNRAGRLTFLPTDSLRPGPVPDPEYLENEKGYLGFACDCVTSETIDQKIIDYELSRVIVCDNLDNAAAMSAKNKDGFRFVTLGGEVINASGAITGGSVKNNTSNILSRKAEKDEITEKLDEISKKLAANAKALSNAEAAAGESEARRNIFVNGMRENEMQKALMAKEMEGLKESLADARANNLRRSEEISDLEAEIAQAEKTIRDINAGFENYDREIALAQDSLDDLTSALQHKAELTEQAREVYTSAKLSESNLTLIFETAADKENSAKLRISELDLQSEAKNSQLESNRINRDQIAVFDETAAEVLAEAEEAKTVIQEELSRLNSEKERDSAALRQYEDSRRTIDSRMYDKQMEKHEAELKLSRNASLMDSQKEKLWEEFEMSYAQASDLMDPEFVMTKGLKEAKECRDRMRALGNVNLGSIEEYKAVKERYEFLIAQQTDLVQAIDELNTVISETDATIKARFKESFDSVVDNFETTFAQLFNGGHAKLSLEDPDNPMESAIEIEAQPPGKKLQNLNLLSGGEKTMTAIALMFAVLKSKPTPFCILDEVEAALDEANIKRFAKYLGNFDNIQFALITHQKATMEYADVMYGITMAEHGVSKVLSLRLDSRFDI